MAAVCHGAFVTLVNCIIQAEYIGSDKGIIGLNDDSNFAKIALVEYHFVNVLEGFFPPLIDDDLNFVSWY